jgi:hypothetical protein
MNKLKFLTLTIVIVLAALGAAPRILTAEASAPTNDDFYTPIVIAVLPFSDTVNTSDAMRDLSDPQACGHPGFNSVWYQITPSEAMSIQITIDANFYTAFGVFTGDYSTGFVEVTCNTYNYPVKANLQGGVTYSIMVASLPDNAYPYPDPGPGETGGFLTINITQLLPPANDNMANAEVIPSMPYSNMIDLTEATAEMGEPRSNCSSYDLSHTVWYSYTPEVSGMLTGYTSYAPYNSIAVFNANNLFSYQELACAWYGNNFQTRVSAGETYLIQISSYYPDYTGAINISLNFTPAPANDDFANAQVISSLPFAVTQDDTVASLEPGEPNPQCAWFGIDHTLWYAYTPGESGSVTAAQTGLSSTMMAAYTGSSLGELTLLRCDAYDYNLFTIHVDAGVTYYFQVGSVSWDYGVVNFSLSVAPPPEVSFWYSPYDPNTYDTVEFCDSSYDPGGEGFNYFWWDFGDSARAEGTNGCASHTFASDLDYLVWHRVQTSDGRMAESVQVVPVRTRDVSITQFTVPQSGKVGQTRTITVGVKNVRYAETVTVELYKSTPTGLVWFGTLTQAVPVRSGNRTTDFKFSYTFSSSDAAVGKITFKAIANIQGARDAYPGDNEAISLPTKVNR